MNTTSRKALSSAVVMLIVSFALPLRDAAGASPDGSGVSVARGARAWANNCASCHNIRDPKDFRSDQWKVIVSHMRLRAGLTGQEARDVLAFLQQSAGSVSSTLPASLATLAARQGSRTGKDVYSQTCIACHGADGKGTIPGAPDLSLRGGVLDKPDDILLRHITEGFQSPGSPMAMPPKGGNSALNEVDLEAALAYMRSNFRR